MRLLWTFVNTFQALSTIEAEEALGSIVCENRDSKHKSKSLLPISGESSHPRSAFVKVIQVAEPQEALLAEIVEA